MTSTNEWAQDSGASEPEVEVELDSEPQPQIDVAAVTVDADRTAKEEADFKAKRDAAVKALASRSVSGCSEKLSIFGDPEDLEYYITLNDVGSELRDKFSDAIGQLVYTSAATYDDQGNEKTGPVMESHRLMRPAVKVLVTERSSAGLRMIKEAVLPQMDDDGNVTAHRLTGKPQVDLEFIDGCGLAMLDRIGTLAQEYYLGGPSGQAVADYLGNLQKKRGGN